MAQSSIFNPFLFSTVHHSFRVRERPLFHSIEFKKAWTPQQFLGAEEEAYHHHVSILLVQEPQIQLPLLFNPWPPRNLYHLPPKLSAPERSVFYPPFFFSFQCSFSDNKIIHTYLEYINMYTFNICHEVIGDSIDNCRIQLCSLLASQAPGIGHL